MSSGIWLLISIQVIETIVTERFPYHKEFTTEFEDI